jgi:hypothetical protein
MQGILLVESMKKKISNNKPKMCTHFVEESYLLKQKLVNL